MELRIPIILKTQARVNWQPILKEQGFSKDFITSLKNNQTRFFFSYGHNIKEMLGFADPQRPFQRIRFPTNLVNTQGLLVIVFEDNYASVGKRQLVGSSMNDDYGVIIQYNILYLKEDVEDYNDFLLEEKLGNISERWETTFEDYPFNNERDMEGLYLALFEKATNYDYSFEEIDDGLFEENKVIVNFTNEYENIYQWRHDIDDEGNAL